MVDPITTRRITYRALFLALAGLILFVGMLPLSAVPPRWPGPDLLLCLAFVWLVRRPDFVPAALIVAVFLVDDLFAMRPPGLWAALVLMATEFLRSRETLLRELPFALEWLLAAVLFLVLETAHWLLLALFIVPQQDFGQTVLRALVTGACYPLVVLASLHAFGLRRTAMGEVDALGHRL
ncbi:rod shape-determining protein MreD [Albidovulum sp.]